MFVCNQFLQISVSIRVCTPPARVGIFIDPLYMAITTTRGTEQKLNLILNYLLPVEHFKE